MSVRGSLTTRLRPLRQPGRRPAVRPRDPPAHEHDRSPRSGPWPPSYGWQIGGGHPSARKQENLSTESVSRMELPDGDRERRLPPRTRRNTRSACGTDEHPAADASRRGVATRRTNGPMGVDHARTAENIRPHGRGTQGLEPAWLVAASRIG